MQDADAGPESGALQEIAHADDVPLDTLDGLWGAMRGTVIIAPGVDLTEPTGEIWDAETGGGKFEALLKKP